MSPWYVSDWLRGCVKKKLHTVQFWDVPDRVGCGEDGGLCRVSRGILPDGPRNDAMPEMRVWKIPDGTGGVKQLTLCVVPFRNVPIRKRGRFLLAVRCWQVPHGSRDASRGRLLALRARKVPDRIWRAERRRVYVVRCRPV